MNKTNIKSPRCHSKKLYKFWFDKQSNQKYQYKECSRQFAPDSVSSRHKSKYHRCPKRNRATYIHHKYKHYNQYRYGNTKYNHAFSQYHNLNINLDSSENLTGSLSMKGMPFPLHTILTSLTLYILNNTSTRAIAQFLKITSNISVSHVTIYNWVHKFALYFK